MIGLILRTDWNNLRRYSNVQGSDRVGITWLTFLPLVVAAGVFAMLVCFRPWIDRWIESRDRSGQRALRGSPAGRDSGAERAPARTRA